MVVDKGRAATQEERNERADLLFHALADATRREIVTLVLTEEHSISALAQRFPMSFAAVQKHVAVLERAGLVVKQRRGREQLVRGDVTALHEVRDLLDRLESCWRGRIHRITDLLAEDAPAAGPSTNDPRR